MSNIHQLVYISDAAEDISYSDIQDILAVSRRHNLQHQITGLLIYRDGFFLQLLEGEEKKIAELVSKIRFDSRNSNLRVIIETASEQRLFPDWAMAFCDGDISSKNTKYLIELFESCCGLDSQQHFLIMPILKKFRASAPDLK